MEFILREWRTTDAASTAEYANNAAIAANLRDGFPHPYTMEDAQAYVQSCVQNEGKGQLCRAIEIEGRAAGSIGLFLGQDVYRKSAELGYWLAQPYWGQGVMSRAITQICDLAFDTLDIVRIYAEPFAPNKGSCRVLEKAGFQPEGRLVNSVYKNGKLMDSCVYALLKPGV